MWSFQPTPVYEQRPLLLTEIWIGETANTSIWSKPVPMVDVAGTKPLPDTHFRFYNMLRVGSLESFFPHPHKVQVIVNLCDRMIP